MKAWEDSPERASKSAGNSEPKESVINLIAHVDHGKTTVMDNILEYLGVLSKSMAGEVRLLDSRKDELERGMTMKLTPVSMFFSGTKITFLDTPGHLEFNSLTESTFIISDMSLVILDVMKGVTKRLKQLVERSVENKCTLILFINKVDLLFKLGISSSEIEHRVFSAISEINQMILEEEKISWESGKVILGSAKDNWALSKFSDPTKLIGKKVEEFSMRKAVKLLKTVYMQEEKKLQDLSIRINRKIKAEVKGKIYPKDIISYEFGFFSALYSCIKTIEEVHLKRGFQTGKCSLSAPDEVCAIICANTLVNNEITAIARTLPGQRILVGETITVMEKNVEAICQVTGLVYFTKYQDRVSVGAGLVGIQGIDCKKRGIIARAHTEKAQKYLQKLKWPKFTPLFTDIIIPAPESYDSIIARMITLSRCEPGMFLSIKEGRIVIRSDGILQIDKIHTDLEGLNYITEEQSEIYQETVEEGYGVIISTASYKQPTFKIIFKGVGSTEMDESKKLEEGFKKLFNRECYVKYAEEVPSEIRMSISSLLQKGPFLQENCNKISVEVFSTDEPATGTIAQIYLQASPRILINHTIMSISVPSAYTKIISSVLSKTQAQILSVDIDKKIIQFNIRIPVSEIKLLTNTLRTQTKGEADILPTNEIFYMVPEKKEYENTIARKLRETKGILQKKRIE